MKTIYAIGFVAVLPLIGFGTEACNKQDAKTVVDFIDNVVLPSKDVACIIAQLTLGISEPALVAAACAIPDSELKYVTNLILAHKQGQVMAAKMLQAGKFVTVDAGTD